MIIRHVPVEYCAQNWHLVEPFIAEAHKWGYGDYSVEQIKVFVMTGQWILLVVMNDNVVHGALTVSFINYPNDRIGFVTAIGGKLLTDADNFEQLKKIFRSYGANKIQAVSRESVARLWKQKLGFNNRAIFVEADI